MDALPPLTDEQREVLAPQAVRAAYSHIASASAADSGESGRTGRVHRWASLGHDRSAASLPPPYHTGSPFLVVSPGSATAHPVTWPGFLVLYRRRTSTRPGPAGRRTHPRGQDLPGRHASTAGPGRQPHRLSVGTVPGRADHRPGPERPRYDLGHHARTGGGRHDAPAHHAVPGGGGPTGPPGGGHRRRHGHRRGPARAAQVLRGWRAPRGRAGRGRGRSPGAPRASAWPRPGCWPPAAPASPCWTESRPTPNTPTFTRSSPT